MRVFRESVILRLAGVGLLLLALAGCPGPRRVGPVPPTPEPATPAPTPTPPPYVPNRRLDTGKIFNGMQYRVTFETETGTTATTERNDPASYRAELTVKVKVPKPHQSFDDLTRLNSQLATVLPGLPALVQDAKISPAFDNLYRLKCAALQVSLNRLDNLLTRHNFYDCETILELQHPQSKRRALFIQADMDVDMDGSDSDRVPEIDGSAVTFQPMTSYRWDKKTAQPNSFITPREARLRQSEAELAGGGLPAARREELKELQARLKSEIADLKSYSFLVGSTDPYIVLPTSMFGKGKGPFAPTMGDYCVVISDGNLYPAIVGDAGPANKIGEASLRICKQILPKSNADFRPASDLKVSYLVFPGSSDRPFSVPDLAKWRAQCTRLLDEIGGIKGELFSWEDLTKPKATPVAPVATPGPTASPVPAPAE